MKLAVLPFNVAEGTSPALGRQVANFAADIVRGNTGAEVNAISYLTQIEDQGQSRAAYANISDSLLEPDWLAQMFQQAPDVDRILDGLLVVSEGKWDLTVRFHEKGAAEPVFNETWSFEIDGLFEHLYKLVKLLAEQAEAQLKGGLESGMEFGTQDAAAFAKFLEGYDAIVYIQQANGLVARAFSPEPSINLLLDAVRADKDFLGPFDALVQLSRMCGMYQIGTMQLLVDTLSELEKLAPDDFKPPFALAELYARAGDLGRASEYFDRAIELNPEEPALHNRQGVLQIQMNMPINAERSFRKAMELEGPDKPSAEMLASVLFQTNRGHEVPGLWKGLIDLNPQNAEAHARYAISLIQTGQVPEGEKAFESGLESVQDNLTIKRFYAPYLVEKKDLDRAMDFYEDCLDAAPTDSDMMLEYARTLQLADREFEIPQVLKDLLATNPEQNLRAQVLAWLIELEQPKRVESVENARQKMEAGDFETAAKELKPMRNWLGDYWKLWAFLASCLNQLHAYDEAEEAARKLLDLYPGCEPAYGELITALNGQGRNDEAYAIMRFAASNMPQSLPVHLNLALAAKRAGHSDEAKSLAQQIRQVVGENEEIEPILAEIEA